VKQVEAQYNKVGDNAAHYDSQPERPLIAVPSLLEEKEAGESRPAENRCGFNKSFYRIPVDLLDSKFHRYTCTEVSKEQSFHTVHVKELNFVQRHYVDVMEHYIHGYIVCNRI
jgi:hypothetical protein